MEEDGGSRRDDQSAVHIEEPACGEIAHRSPVAVALGERRLPSSGHFLQQLGLRKRLRVERENVSQDCRLVANVQLGGGRGAVIVGASRLVVHGSEYLLCHAPGCSTSAG